MAKGFVAEAANDVCGECIQIHGGVGFTWDCDAHLLYRRAKQDDLLLGSGAGSASGSPTWSSPPDSFWSSYVHWAAHSWDQNGFMGSVQHGGWRERTLCVAC